MKTFELPDHLADKLIAIGKELAHQNNRSTAWPVWSVLDNGKMTSGYGAGIFLTGKAAEKHITELDYHYDRPGLYIVSAHANDELQPIIQALILMAGEEVPSNHYGRVE